MKFWKDNQLAREYQRPVADVALQFWNSPYGGAQLRGSTWPLERSLRAFLTDPQGFSSSWEEADFPSLWQAVRDSWPAAETAEAAP